MRRPRREIEIFSMSVLDMFASALGAFIMITIILYKDYDPAIKAKLTAMIEGVAEKRRVLQSISERTDEQLQRNARQQTMVNEQREEQNRTRRCQQELAVCISELSETFLMVMMQWTDNVAADLYVKDPQGHEFDWEKHNREGDRYPRQAQLSYDMNSGPGLEVWVSPRAVPGDYEVEYRLSRKYGRSIAVSGYVLDRTGRRQLPTKTLSDSTPNMHAATLNLSAEGKITIRP